MPKTTHQPAAHLTVAALAALSITFGLVAPAACADTATAPPLAVMSRDVVESVEGCAANRRVVSVVVVEVEPAGQRQASFGL